MICLEIAQVQGGEEYETIVDSPVVPRVGEMVRLPGLGQFPALVGCVVSVRHTFNPSHCARIQLNTLASPAKWVKD